MKVFDVIHVGCAILSASAEVAPFVKDYVSKKRSKRMAARKEFRQPTVETDNEDDEEYKPTRTLSESSQEDKGIKEAVLKDLMITIQTQSEALQEHSEVISHLVSERGLVNSERLSSIPEDKTRSYFASDYDTRRLSLGTTLRNFSFPPLETLEDGPSTSTSRASSISISSTSMPPSPVTSYSSMASFSTQADDHRSSSITSRHSSCIDTNPVSLSSSRPGSFTNGSYQPANIGRRVTFGSSCSKVVLHQAASQSKRQAAELFVEKALAASLPNKYQGAHRSLPRNMSFPASDLPPQPPWRQSEDSASGPLRIEHRPAYHRSQSLSPKGSPPTPLRSPETIQRAIEGPRATSYTPQAKRRHSSLQPSLSPKIHQRPTEIPSKEQWRSSLKSSSQCSTSPASSTRADDSDSSPRQSYSSSISNSQLVRRQKSRPTSPSSNSFMSVLTQTNLWDIQQHLNSLPIDEMTHYASTWSYKRTISQFLHPDHYYLHDDDMIHRCYLSSSIRSHIYLLAHTISRDENKEERDEEEGDCFPLVVFLLRLVMFLGIGVLRDAPVQCMDSTGLRGMESSYQLAREMRLFLRERDEKF